MLCLGLAGAVSTGATPAWAEQEEDEAPVQAPAPATAPSTRWQPPEPDEGGWDWLRTTSGEWLKGDLTRMRDREFEFDSDEFDDVKVDQEDVADFRLVRAYTYRFRGRETFRGTAQQQDGVIKVRTQDGEIIERDATHLVSISRGAGVELQRWSADLGVGATLRSGNTDQTDISGKAKITRETAFTRYRLDYRGAWSKVDSDKTTNNHRVMNAFDYFLSWRFFVTLPFLEFFTDEFQNIDGRYTPGVGVGYEVIDSSRLEWDVSSGAAYQRTVFTSGADDDNDGALLFGTAVELEVTKNLDWDTSYDVQLIVTDFEKTNHHLRSELSFDIWGPIDFDLTFIWDRIESPESESDGSQPDSDDFRMEVGFSIEL